MRGLLAVALLLSAVSGTDTVEIPKLSLDLGSAADPAVKFGVKTEVLLGITIFDHAPTLSEPERALITKDFSNAVAIADDKPDFKIANIQAVDGTVSVQLSFSTYWNRIKPFFNLLQSEKVAAQLAAEFSKREMLSELSMAHLHLQEKKHNGKAPPGLCAPRAEREIVRRLSDGDTTRP